MGEKNIVPPPLIPKKTNPTFSNSSIYSLKNESENRKKTGRKQEDLLPKGIEEKPKTKTLTSV
jgi:hypothetical protein